eukprot:3938098-Rhodomonas_salina.2
MLEHGDGAEYMVDTEELEARAAAENEVEDEQDANKPSFGTLSATEMNGGKTEYRRVAVPAHRFTPLKEHWLEIYEPIVKHMKLQVVSPAVWLSVQLAMLGSDTVHGGNSE